MVMVHLHVQEEEVMEQLQRRRPDLADPGGDIKSSSDEDNANFSNDGYTSEEEVDKNGISEKSVFFDKKGETTLQWPLSGNGLRAKDVDIQELVSAVINNQKEEDFKDEILSGSSIETLRLEEKKGKRENVRIDLAEESDEEVIELEFERAVEKVHTHTPHCPNCSAQITKVILRRRKRNRPRPGKPVDLFGCLKCFRIFIPSGDCLSFFPIFGSEGKQESPKIVDDKDTTEASRVRDPVSAGGFTSSEDSDQLKHKGESKNEKDNFKKPGLHPGITPPHVVVAIDSGFETDGTKDGVTDPGKSEVEIKEEGDKSRPHSEPDEATLGKITSDQRGKTNTNVGNLAAGSGTLEILKCIVYGGLIESITSFSVIASAAASGAATLNVIAIALATVFSGLIALGHNLMDLNNNVSGGNSNYQELLGRKEHFLLHATFTIFSYLIFGLIPPITYGFTFRESDNKDYKILAVAAASFACIFILAIAKAYVRRPEKLSDYVKTIMYYVTMAISASGVAYAAGDLIKMLMEKLGWFKQTQTANFMVSATPSWASY